MVPVVVAVRVPDPVRVPEPVPACMPNMSLMSFVVGPVGFSSMAYWTCAFFDRGFRLFRRILVVLFTFHPSLIFLGSFGFDFIFMFLPILRAMGFMMGLVVAAAAVYVGCWCWC